MGDPLEQVVELEDAREPRPTPPASRSSRYRRSTRTGARLDCRRNRRAEDPVPTSAGVNSWRFRLRRFSTPMDRPRRSGTASWRACPARFSQSGSSRRRSPAGAHPPRGRPAPTPGAATGCREVAFRVGDAEAALPLVEDVHGEGVEVGDASDEPRQLAVELREIEHRCHFAPEREERRQELAVALRHASPLAVARRHDIEIDGLGHEAIILTGTKGPGLGAGPSRAPRRQRGPRPAGAERLRQSRAMDQLPFDQTVIQHPAARYPFLLIDRITEFAAARTSSGRRPYRSTAVPVA